MNGAGMNDDKAVRLIIAEIERRLGEWQEAAGTGPTVLDVVDELESLLDAVYGIKYQTAQEN